MIAAYVNAPIYQHTPATYDWQYDRLPLPSEHHVAAWQGYQAEAVRGTAWEALRSRLVQLQFPIHQGISQTAVYHAATKQGVDTTGWTEASGLLLEQPDALQLHIHQSIAGDVPALITATRADFCALVQALTKRNEPSPIPDSMGACMVAGYNNWDRVRAYRRQWLTADPRRTPEDWPHAFQELIPQKHLYQDRFIILGQGPYSNVAAASLGLDADEWRSLSLTIRLEHECAHYFTKRVFGVIRQHLHDELLADYAGIVAAIGHYRADWALRFMGLEEYPAYRAGGRLENYLDSSLRPEPAFSQIMNTFVTAVYNLERFDRALTGRDRDMVGRGALLCALAGMNLADLAAAADERLAENVCAWKEAILSAARRIEAMNNETPLPQVVM
ncbi:MAG: hypothetical protein IPM39_28080 [Chloroflexi bacterium]|nr:hypothetical protein [Chloroflexota bacterium]